jgi:anion-transporting  ArsA/GET3 family ATPase
MIRKRPQTQANRSMYFSMYDQIRQLDGYIRQMRLITSQNVQSLDDLFVLRTTLHEKIETMTKERSTLYKANDREAHHAEIDQLTFQLKELRRSLRDCESIETRSIETDQRIRQVQEQEEERQRKEQQERMRGRSI